MENIKLMITHILCFYQLLMHVKWAEQRILLEVYHNYIQTE
jgi:hypothetical protein